MYPPPPSTGGESDAPPRCDVRRWVMKYVTWFTIRRCEVDDLARGALALSHSRLLREGMGHPGAEGRGGVEVKTGVNREELGVRGYREGRGPEVLMIRRWWKSPDSHGPICPPRSSSSIHIPFPNSYDWKIHERFCTIWRTGVSDLWIWPRDLSGWQHWLSTGTFLCWRRTSLRPAGSHSRHCFPITCKVMLKEWTSQHLIGPP